MSYGHSLDESKAIAQKALESMTRLEVRPTPANYEVWYEYASGRNPALNQTLDILMTNNDDFSESRCREIYHQFFTADYDAKELSGTARAVQKQVSRILDFIEQLSSESEDYGHSLKDLSAQLLADLDIEDIRALIDTVIERTDHMQSSNQKLKLELETSSEEIFHLREDLTLARRETLTDPLTGLANRKGFDEKLRESVMAAMETGDPTSLIMADIDHFKKFNDKWGHLLGDHILKFVAGQLTKHVRGRDTVARFGGEEFVILLVDTTFDSAVGVAETLREAISSQVARKKDTGETVGRITCSFGVATFQPGEPLKQFIGRADAALYRAKGAGRNCVIGDNLMPSESPVVGQPVA